MNICLIGHGITCLILGNILSDKNIKISIFEENKYKNKFNTRTLSITKNNLDFLKRENINLKNKVWPINNIKIFNTSSNKKEVLSFSPDKDSLFSLIKNYKLIDLLKKNIKKKKFIRKIKTSKNKFYK